MPAAKKPASKTKATAAARARAEADDRQLDRVVQALEAAQEDLSSIKGTVGTGVRDLRRDATKLLRDARRDVVKMRRAVQRDLVSPAEGPRSGGAGQAAGACTAHRGARCMSTQASSTRRNGGGRCRQLRPRSPCSRLTRC